MIDRRLLRLASGAYAGVAAVIALNLAITATYVGQGLAVATALGRVLDGGGWSSIVPAVTVVVLLQAVRAGVVAWREACAVASAGVIKQRVRTTLYAKLLELGPGYATDKRTGTIQSSLGDGVETLEKYFGQFLPLLIASTLGALGIVVYLAMLDPVVGIVVFVSALLVPVAPVATRRMLGQRPKEHWQQYRDLYAESLDALQGMAALKAFNAHRRRQAELHDRGAGFARASTRLVAVWAISEGIVGLAASAGTALSVGVGALRLAGGTLALPELLIILLLARECFRPLTDLQAALHSAYPARSAVEGIDELLSTEPVVANTAAAPSTVPARADIAFEQVTFRYSPDRASALERLDLMVAAGETVALVGRSGAGKTTVVSLLLRFFDPQQGRVSVGGVDIRDLTLTTLRSMLAVVSQDTYLFHGTVARNLRLGRSDASDDELEAATRAANAHGFIAALPDGYDTVVGERGLRLSGGQRQRIAIARALLADAPILLLDEATSSVDAASETAIQMALERLTVGRTTLIVAHRLSTVRNADRIVVLDAGRSVEAGTHSQLVDHRGAYAGLVAAQETSL